VITVAASDRRGYLATRYSNFGARVDIMAPGGDVRQDSDSDGNPDGVLSMVDGGYAYYNGTSMAAPHTAGVAALLLAEDGARTPDQIRSLLKTRAMKRTVTQCPKPCGAGLLNAAATQPVPPVPGVAITLAPSALSVETGKSAEVSATVLRNGVADSGKNVAFVSSNTAVFSVTPASTTTDASGVAKATVTAVAAGDATLQAESQGALGTAAVKVTPKKIPALPLPFVGVLLLAALLLYAWRVRRTQGA
jgi:serine protease